MLWAIIVRQQEQIIKKTNHVYVLLRYNIPQNTATFIILGSRAVKETKTFPLQLIAAGFVGPTRRRKPFLYVTTE